MKALIALVLTATVLGISSRALASARVSSNSNCPSSDAISLRLLGLLAAGGPESASAWVRSEGDSMRIEVSTPGEESRQRTVEVTGDCDSRAEMAAFIIAAWLDAMPVGTVSSPGIPPREVQPAPRISGVVIKRLSFSSRTLLSGGVFGLGDSLGASAGLAALIGMPNLIENVGWLLEGSMTLSRQMGVGTGTAHIRRPTFVLAATFELYRKRWLLRAEVGPALGILLFPWPGRGCPMRCGFGWTPSPGLRAVAFSVSSRTMLSLCRARRCGWCSGSPWAFSDGCRARLSMFLGMSSDVRFLVRDCKLTGRVKT